MPKRLLPFIAIIASLGLTLPALAASSDNNTSASSTQWVEGTNYHRIEPAQPKVTDTDKVEVVEVFSWGCPACNHAHAYIAKMAKALPDYATMAYLPASFRPDENWPVYQRAWYAAKALKVAKKSLNALFDTTWKTGETATYELGKNRLKSKSKWPTIKDIAEVYKRYNIDPETFIGIANSFAVNTQMKRADKLIKDYGVMATPTIVVNGQYRFSFRSAGGYEKGIELAKYLAAKVHAESQ